MSRAESFLPGFNSKTAGISHGGDHRVGRRKIARPIDPKQALHVVMRSSKARGEHSMLHPKHCDAVHAFTQKLATQWGVRLYRYANVGNHIHLLIKVPSRAIWQRFSRELAGGIAIIVTGARKGEALPRSRANSRSDANDKNPNTLRGFWDGLTFTRIVNFGRDFAGMKRYLVKNLFESMGINMKKLLAQGLKVMTISEDGKVSGVPA